MKRQWWWVAFIAFSLLLFGGYYAGLSHHELEPYLKGLNTLQHFGIHYVVGVFAALIFSLGWLAYKKRRANEPALLLLFVLLAHAPDFRFAIRKLPHDPWEVLFLGHTVVDEAFYPLFWVFLLANIGLIAWYRQKVRKLKEESK